MKFFDYQVWALLHEGKQFSTGCHWSIGLFILAETINALEYMHKKGIVHRDLKVENMMLTSAGII